MGITSLQVCMDSSDWLQGTIHEECAAGVGGMDSSSSPSGGDHINNLMTCSRPIIVDQRRLRPPHDHSIKCPRCDSTHTKFCYYNNYSLTQPRYFCKTCRRYWTKGGTLRNIPVGGGCRKNKKVSSKKSSNNNTNETLADTTNNSGIPEMPFPLHNHHFMSGGATTNFGHHGNFILENQAPVIDFMESKYEALMGSTSTNSRNQDLFLGNGDNNNIGMMMISGGSSTTTGFGHDDTNIVAPNYPFGMTTMDNGNNFGMLLPYENINHHHEEVQNINNAIDVKPNPKILSLEWHDNDQLGVNKESSSFGYYSGSGGLGSWTGLMNGTNCYGSSATNPLV